LLPETEPCGSAEMPWPWHARSLTLLSALAAWSGSAETGAANDMSSRAWRISNAGDVHVAWRVRSLQFFYDDSCTKPVIAEPNHTGVAFASEPSEMTGADYVYALRSPRGWESVDACSPGQCHVGFELNAGSVADVRCLLLHQGEEGLHADAVTLQHRVDTDWVSVVTWKSVVSGKVKLALSCPPTPASIENGRISDCQVEDERSQRCLVTCNAGFGTVEPSLRCIHGAWYFPECLPVASLVRLVARAPELIKPYWVVLDAKLFSDEECTQSIEMDGMPTSSGEYVIKYANYHPRNIWDGDASTSWASAEHCEPGSCHFGFRFRQPLKVPIRCAKIEHPHGSQYHATSVAVEVLGSSGWEEAADIKLILLPEANQEL